MTGKFGHSFFLISGLAMMLPVLYSSPEVEVTEIILQNSETFVSWLDTNADLSQILDFLVHRASLCTVKRPILKSSLRRQIAP